MSESDALLPPPGGEPAECSPTTYQKCKQRTAYVLEHPTLHKLVIFLVRLPRIQAPARSSAHPSIHSPCRAPAYL